MKFRLPKYVLLFGLLVTALYFLKGGTPIKDLDHFVYKSLYFSNSDNVKINPDIMVIDIEWPGELDSQIEEFREQLANLIDNIG
ncbi:MAG: hypothetical protein HKO94_13155, partial [Flavobacteriaceae bacterium]|nr:hypothetical protein [Flavobacteriaceae bacterium]